MRAHAIRDRPTGVKKYGVHAWHDGTGITRTVLQSMGLVIPEGTGVR